MSWQIMTHFEISWKLSLEPKKKLRTLCTKYCIVVTIYHHFTYIDWIQNFYCSQAPISLVGYFVDLAIGAFTYGLYNFPGICGIWKRFKSEHCRAVVKQSIQVFPGGEKVRYGQQITGLRVVRFQNKNILFLHQQRCGTFSFHFPFHFK